MNRLKAISASVMLACSSASYAMTDSSDLLNSFDSESMKECLSPAVHNIESLDDIKTLSCYLNANQAQNLDFNGLEKLVNLETFELIFESNVELDTALDLQKIALLPNLTSFTLYSGFNADLSVFEQSESLIELRVINFSHTPLLTFNSLGNLTNLEKLVLGIDDLEESSDVSIKDINFISKLDKLQYLVVADLKLKDISAIANMPQLNKLLADSNNISDISALSDLQNLSIVNLSDNLIKDVSPLVNLASLDTAMLLNNAITDASQLSLFPEKIYLALDLDDIDRGQDNCPLITNPEQWDKDKDGIGNECDLDIDGDGCANDIEDALGTKKWDKDSVPELCEIPSDDDTDLDGDGIIDRIDNCPEIANAGQWDKDNDGIGNECDLDIDGDLCPNDIEISLGFKPWNKNSKPEICGEPVDRDNDGLFDHVDNCPLIPNPGQWNKDGDQFGNECDDDIDGDGYPNEYEQKTGTSSWDARDFLVDSDDDGIPDKSDNCPSISNPGQWNKDGDEFGNECDDDIDGDGYSNEYELKAGTSIWNEADFDVDSDNDGTADGRDNCPQTYNAAQVDLNNNNIGDMCELSDIAESKGPVSYYGELITSGNRILSANTNRETQVRGASFFWSNFSQQFWHSGTVERMVDEFQVELLRASFGVRDDGTPFDVSTEANLHEVVEAAIARDVYIIIDWHSHGAHNNAPAAMDFFERMAKIYGHHDNVIFEIFSEPTNERSSGVTWPIIKDYTAQVLPVIREYSDNLVIVGTTTWSQDVDVASESPILSDNIAYAFHFFTPAHGQKTKDQLDVALAAENIPIFVSEWGFHAQTFQDEEILLPQAWMDTLDEHKLSWANWAINDKYGRESLFLTDGGLSESGIWLKETLAEYAKTAEWRLSSDELQPLVELSTDNKLVVSSGDKRGFSLYLFDNDLNNDGSVCNDGCAATWPPLLLADAQASGLSDDSELGSITRDDGTEQVTYKERPVYLFAGDSQAGDQNGQGIGGVWWLAE